FGDRLIAAYELGSLAHGGFDAVSDVDLAMILRGPATRADSSTIASAVAEVQATGKPFADRLSVFWAVVEGVDGMVSSAHGRLPLYDAVDLNRHGRLLFGVDIRDRLAIPARETILIESAELWARVFERQSDPALIAARDPWARADLWRTPVEL